MSKRIFSALIVWATMFGVVAVQPVSAAAPPPPTGVDAERIGTVDLLVSWDTAPPPTTPPDSDAVTGYTVTLDDAATTTLNAPADGTSVTFVGLTPGQTYIATVEAANAASETSSASSPAVTIPGPPGAPTGLAAAATGETSATVEFDAPSDTGGDGVTITGYTVASSPGGGVGSSSGATSIDVTGLVAGQAYTFTVRATNSDDQTGPASAPSNPVTTDVAVTTPSQPTAVSASAGVSQATVTFNAPASNGGSGITSYAVTASPGGRTATGSGSPISISGLTAGTTYTFTVTATNAAGTGPPGGPSNAVSMPDGPGAPTGVSALLAGNNSATISFSSPGDNGGSPITGYTVVAFPGGKQATGGGSPITINGLDSGTTYTFVVRASNAVGTGANSGGSNPVTTPNSPSAPSNANAVLSGNTSATVAFDEANGNGADITEYTVVASPGDIEATGDGSPIEVTGLEPGETYTFQVFASNSVGDGQRSSPSDELLVPIVPGLALITDVTNAAPYNSTVAITWEPPTESGGSPVTQYVVTLDGVEQILDSDTRSATFTAVAVGTHTPTLVAVTIAGRGPVATGPEVQVRAFAPFDSERAFIAQLYRDFLGREADEAGLAYWTGVTADDGSNVEDVARSFMFSPEFNPRRSITRLYLAFFDRRPDIGGFDYWAERIVNGDASLDTISESFVKSKEFQDTYGLLSNQNFIRLVYNNVLVREPDQSGYSFWLAQMANGMTRGELMTSFSESPEFVAGTRPAVDVIVTYRGMLNRPPDDAGFVFWLGQIAGDSNAITSLIAGFYSSQEFADRVTP